MSLVLHKLDQITLFLRERNHNIIYVVVYVDDIIVIDSNFFEIKILKTQLERKYKLKDLGKLSYFLGIEVSYLIDGNFLSQWKYAQDIIQESGLSLQEINVSVKDFDRY